MSSKKMEIDSKQIAWEMIDSYFKDNPNHITKHHIDSYNSFIHNDIPKIFKLHNPMRIIKEQDEKTNEYNLQCELYFGGLEGNKIYYGKPVIYEDDGTQHYMMPNEARLRNMTYAITIHYDVYVKFKEIKEDGSIDEYDMTLEKIYLGRFPIMLHSDLCILKNMSPQERFYNGECKEDQGGYFIIDGKEKVIVSQEKFANNILNIKDKVNELYSHAAEIRTVSEDPSKPQRNLSVRIVAPTPTLKNGQIVVNVPNVRKPVPLFILMRALGVESDYDIIQHCLLDMDKQKEYIDLFIPSVHDANPIYTQDNALQYIATLTKHKTIPSTMHILMDYFMPNVGELNFSEKALALGYMVFRLLRVYTKDDEPTDRDSFAYKRIELTGSLIYDLFNEYYQIQKKEIFQKIDRKYYYNESTYQNNFRSLIESNYTEYFSEKVLERGIMKGFKGAWGATENTRRPGVLQTLNRLSYFSFISHLRKLNLPMDSSAKVVKPRLLHSTQWGVICPVETPDGGNIGFHKHMTITAQVTTGVPAKPVIEWLYKHGVRSNSEYNLKDIFSLTKVFVNGSWIGVTDVVQDVIHIFKLYRRVGLINIFNSIRWNIKYNELHIQTDDGRLVRPLLYVENETSSIFSQSMINDFKENKKMNWEKLLIGFLERKDSKWNMYNSRIYEIDELYDIPKDESNPEKIFKTLHKNKGVIDMIDTMESESSLISITHRDFKYKNTTHTEIHPSLMLGVMGNMVVFPENNQLPRDLFSCGQGKQGVSTYHSNWQNRIDKMGIILNYGQNPIVQSRYYNYVTKDTHPYGENAIVAISCYNGYNVEDALIFNKSAIDRGLFRTTYLNMYETREEAENVGGGVIDKQFANVTKENVLRMKPGYDYAYLDSQGLIKENTYMNDKIVVIGKMVLSSLDGSKTDESIVPKKGQKGYVDKSFITEGDEGKRIAKVRIREERKPAIGDKFCSRAGQKGTVGIVLAEEDMPYTKDGIRPDLIVNPHALPSRMTIGQLVECLMGKTCSLYGGYGDCTAFVNNGPKHKVFGEMLTKEGFHSSGTEILMNGMTGQQMESEIFIGPTYYLRLKHMVKDKINYRATGPRTQMTRQTLGGRAKDGGLRIGEMERDGVIAHGMSYFLQESMLTRGDDYYMAICNKTGSIAIYNEKRDIYLSPQADGPLLFNHSLDGNFMIENKSKHGKDFSIVRVPYCFKLLLQELKTMNISMKIITDENIDQLTAINDIKYIQKHTGFNNFDEIYNALKNASTAKLVKKDDTIVVKDDDLDISDLDIDLDISDDTSKDDVDSLAGPPKDRNIETSNTTNTTEPTESTESTESTETTDTSGSILPELPDTNTIVANLTDSFNNFTKSLIGGGNRDVIKQEYSDDLKPQEGTIKTYQVKPRGELDNNAILSNEYTPEVDKRISELEQTIHRVDNEPDKNDDSNSSLFQLASNATKSITNSIFGSKNTETTETTDTSTSSNENVKSVKVSFT
jgi:DNA-directed RNA polymerase II subunit RPB2